MKTIAILAAMRQELDAVLEAFKFATPYKSNFCKMPVYVHEQNGVKFVFALSGVGRVNTAMNASLIIREFEPSEVINVGSGGGLKKNQKILDIVVPSEIVAVDIDLTIFGCEYGQISEIPNPHFVNKQIQDKILLAAKDLVTVHTGTVGSSESFICREEQVSEICRRFEDRVICVEMEAFSVAVVCQNFNIPFAVIRSLSDVPAKGEGNENDFNQFLIKAAKNAAQILYRYEVSDK